MNLTVDYLLRRVVPTIKSNSKLIPTKDKRILLSLFNQMDKGHFLTENQSKLLVKIFVENQEVLEKIEINFDSIIKNNLWSQAFRTIQRIRKISLSSSLKDTILVEFTYDKRIKEKLIALNSKIDGAISAVGSKSYAIMLTEKNVYTLVSTFLKDDFEIEVKIMDFYLEIEKIMRGQKKPFDIFLNENEILKKQLEEDIGALSNENKILIHDRKIRYQYDFSEKIGNFSLAEKIALRKFPKIYIDPKQYLFSDLVNALQQLKRWPLLCVFEGHDPKINKKSLDLIKNVESSNNAISNIGIYFRFDSNVDKIGFNSAVAEFGYNKLLDDNVTLVGIANNKLPKFMVKMGWKPESIISFTSTFKENKSYCYLRSVDLIIYYTDKLPLTKEVDVIL